MANLFWSVADAADGGDREHHYSAPVQFRATTLMSGRRRFAADIVVPPVNQNVGGLFQWLMPCSERRGLPVEGFKAGKEIACGIQMENTDTVKMHQRDC